jgi:two-component SAPR family response regulator
MNSQNVLVLGNHANRDLVDVLSNIGFVPQLWGSIQHSLDRVRHEKFAAIFIDRKVTRVDVLEFILNVRDIDQKIPVVVIGPAKDEQTEKNIRKLHHTIIFDDSERDDTLGEKIEHALKINKVKDV